MRSGPEMGESEVSNAKLVVLNAVLYESGIYGVVLILIVKDTISIPMFSIERERERVRESREDGWCQGVSF